MRDTLFGMFSLGLSSSGDLRTLGKQFINPKQSGEVEHYNLLVIRPNVLENCNISVMVKLLKVRLAWIGYHTYIATFNTANQFNDEMFITESLIVKRRSI